MFAIGLLLVIVGLAVSFNGEGFEWDNPRLMARFFGGLILLLVGLTLLKL